MSDDQWAEFMAAMRANNTPQLSASAIMDMLNKILVPIITGLLFFVSTFVFKSNADIKLLQDDMGRIDEFMKEPRFTRGDFEQGSSLLRSELNVEIANVANAVSAINVELTRRSDFMDDTDRSLLKVADLIDAQESRLRNLELYKTDLERIVGTNTGSSLNNRIDTVESALTKLESKVYDLQGRDDN